MVCRRGEFEGVWPEIRIWACGADALFEPVKLVTGVELLLLRALVLRLALSCWKLAWLRFYVGRAGSLICSVSVLGSTCSERQN